MKKSLLFLFAAVLALLATGCATIFTGTSHTMIVTAPEGTRLYCDGMKIAEIYPGEDSAIVTLPKRLSGPMMIAKKEGYKDLLFQLRGTVEGTVFVNILLGPAMLLGGAVDVATGAAVRYPNQIFLELEPLY